MKCDICPNYCELTDDKKTICNQEPIFDSETKIYTTNTWVSPIEEGLLYHFLPGSKTLNIALSGCNLSCKYCSRAELTQAKDDFMIPTHGMRPNEIVQIAIDNQCHSITWKNTEPTIHPKWIINTARIAKRYNIYTILVTNGFTSPETLEKLSEYVDAVNVEIKSLKNDFYTRICGARLKPVLNSIEFYKSHGIHLEIEYSPIPDFTDDTESMREVIMFIRRLSYKIPMHFTQYHPDYMMADDTHQTPEKVIMKAYDLAQYNQIKYVYPDINISPTYKLSTRCEHCKEVIIKRDHNYEVTDMLTSQGACPKCSYKANIIKK